MPIDWENLLTVDCDKITSLFVGQRRHSEPKLEIRGYSLPFCGTQQRWDAVIDELSRLMLKYVFPETERPEDIDWHKARDKFGNISPQSDGKLGEMLLYFLVESVIKTPLMGYKLKDLSNPNDQVKGADGIFVGPYKNNIALLIGESKIHKDVRGAIASAIVSLHRFHSEAGPYANELIIARKYPKERGLSREEIDVVMGIIDGSQDCVLVHPVLIAYDLKDICDISLNARNRTEAEKKMTEVVANEIEIWIEKVYERKKWFRKPYQAYLDFFFIPSESSLHMREQFYERLHGHSFDYEKAKIARELKEIKKAK